KVDRLVGLWKDSKATDLDSVVAIMEKNKDLAKDIREILKLLLMDNRDAELRAEIARLQDLIKKLNEIIRQQQTLRAWTERGGKPNDQLGKDQKKLTEATKDLAKAMGKAQGEKAGEPKAGEPKAGDPKSGKPGESGPPKVPGPKQEGDAKSGEKKDDDQPAGKNMDGKKQVEDATHDQKKAEENINKDKKPDASGNQDDAIKKLKEAMKKPEELLAQLRQEEMERKLAARQAQCERM